MLTGLVAIQLGSCYRAEIDLSAYADMVAGAGTTGASSAGGDLIGLAGMASGVGGIASGAGGVASGAGAGGDAGGNASAMSGAGGEGGTPAQSGDGAGGDSAGAGGQCQDPALSAWDHSCLISGLKPSTKVCAPQDLDGWKGCYDGGCMVCTRHGVLPGYPYYFAWHPCCSPNDTCSNHNPFYCNPLCPPPTEHDQVAPCGTDDPNPG
ncbi:MAG TPA: hypothetical protein VHB79_17630 [Polyangiaceae bacterium]|nr:hypothetical protein [Polyangiaceae bacterium]